MYEYLYILYILPEGVRPLWIGGLLPLYVGAVALLTWIFRGSFRPVRCGYPVIPTGAPCTMWVAGEWYRCRYHRGRRADINGDVPVKRWQTINRRAEPVELPAIGVGVVRTRPLGRALLYHNGYARRPLDALRVAPDIVAHATACFKEIRIRRDPSEPFRDELDEMYSISDAERVASRARATQLMLAAFTMGIGLALLSALLAGPGRFAMEWASVLGFAFAWAAITSGIYLQDDEWLFTTAIKGIRWWLVAFVPFGAVELIATVAHGKAPAIW